MKWNKKEVVNEILSTKWIVIGLTSFFVYYHNYQVIIFVIGAITQSFIGKGLKKILKQPRPSSSTRITYGMPSSHSNVLFFFSVYISQHILRSSSLFILPLLQFFNLINNNIDNNNNINNNINNPNNYNNFPYVSEIEIMIMIFISTYLSIIRIINKEHSFAQIFVGAIVGSISALIFYPLVN